MINKRPYQKLLRKMLTLEIIGEKLYSALALKVKDKNLKSIYQKLAVNESQTGACIEKELKISCENTSMLYKIFISNTAGLFFSLFSARILLAILENALKKRVYSRWHKLYNSDNQEFWGILLQHEDIQREFLNLSGG